MFSLPGENAKITKFPLNKGGKKKEAEDIFSLKTKSSIIPRKESFSLEKKKKRELARPSTPEGVALIIRVITMIAVNIDSRLPSAPCLFPNLPSM